MSINPGQELISGVVLANVASGVSAGTELGPSATDGELASGSDGYSAVTDEGDAAGLSTAESIPSGYAGVRVTGDGEITYEGTSGAGNFDPSAGDVFIFDQRVFRRRQLSPLSTVPLGRVGLADKAAMFEYKTNIDKSHGAHVKYLQDYPTA